MISFYYVDLRCDVHSQLWHSTHRNKPLFETFLGDKIILYRFWPDLKKLLHFFWLSL